MALSETSGVGAVVAADIAVPEHQRELRFYSRVLTTGRRPLWREDLMNSEGLPVIGLGERGPGHAKLPLQWMPHIQVADVGASAERALDRGGREIMHHRNEHGHSEWAVLTDPDGAAFGVIPVVAPVAIPPRVGGRIAWLELAVADVRATLEFYREVVGWSSADVEMEDATGPYTDYTLFAPDGTAVAGVLHVRGVNADLPPVWLIHLPVGDLDESLRRARDEGGEVVLTREKGTGDHPCAVVRDPVGVCVALVPDGGRAAG